MSAAAQAGQVSPTDQAGQASPEGQVQPWLFGKRTDLLAFGGSAAVSLLLLAIGGATGLLAGETPLVLWFLLVVVIDVAHVWTTLFRVYLDGEELRRRPVLYTATPMLTYVALVGLHAVSAGLFWRTLAYVAVFHFVRQQVGWLSLYQGRGPHTPPWERRFERLTLYASMVYPLLYWHAHLPTGFHWFMAGDFVAGLPAGPIDALALPYWSLLGAYGLRQLWRWQRGRLHMGKVLLVGSTWACWHLGIVTFGSDYGFTVTNVIIHGVPYAVLVYRYSAQRRLQHPGTLAARLLAAGVWSFLLVSVGLGFLEETLWDRFVWHDHAQLWGTGPTLSLTWLAWLVPLLALPQATHYVLDGLIWRRTHNPDVPRALTPLSRPSRG